MRKQLIHIILLAGVLCASEFLSGIKTFRAGRLVHVQTSNDVLGLDAAVTRNFDGAWKSAAESAVGEGRWNSCASTRTRFLFVAWSQDGQYFRKVPVWQLSDNSAFFFVSGMTIDADGAPNAYNPDDTGLDDLANAGVPANWNGIITDQEGNPLIQQQSDPFPGYYISCTSLSDKTKKFTDPTSYVDASKIPYVVLPRNVANRGGARLGDFAFVLNVRNGKSSFAIYADVGTLGEGSIALADNLGIWSNARQGGQPDGVLYLVFPGSGNLQPRTIGEIKSEGEKLLHHWGGLNKLSSCAVEDDSTVGHVSTGSAPKLLSSSR